MKLVISCIYLIILLSLLSISLFITFVSGVQATVVCRDIGVGMSRKATPFQFSSSQVKRPCKRARMDMEEDLEEEDPLESSSVMGASTYDPADSVTVQTESTIVS